MNTSSCFKQIKNGSSTQLSSTQLSPTQVKSGQLKLSSAQLDLHLQLLRLPTKVRLQLTRKFVPARLRAEPVPGFELDAVAKRLRRAAEEELDPCRVEGCDVREAGDRLEEDVGGHEVASKPRSHRT